MDGPEGRIARPAGRFRAKGASQRPLEKAIAYVFQIVPKDARRYDCPWNVSGREPRENVRCCDGMTAYELVFGREDALQEIYRALPFVLSDITGKPVLVEEGESTSLFYQSFPADGQ